MRSYKKLKQKPDTLDLSAEELIKMLSRRGSFSRLKMFLLLLSVCMVVSFVKIKSLNDVTLDNMTDEPTLSMATIPISATGSKKDLISIPSGTVKANPFLPYRDIGGNAVSDVPNYDLVAPPETVNEYSEASRVMDTIVSGILYDKFSPSAILNIEGNDYLVKKGDVVNNYHILNIMQDSVTVKLGANVYKAGIGEILTEGSVNNNDVSNLSKKFGGRK